MLRRFSAAVLAEQYCLERLRLLAMQVFSKEIQQDNVLQALSICASCTTQGTGGTAQELLEHCVSGFLSLCKDATMPAREELVKLNPKVLVAILRNYEQPLPFVASFGDVPQSTLKLDIQKLYRNKRHSDCRLVIASEAGAESLRAHKPVLVARSSFFQAAFAGAMVESRTSTIELPVYL